jgi:integrase/recombinase XerC
MLTSGKVLSREEQAHLVRLLRRTSQTGNLVELRDALLILLTLECGLRATEATRLRVGDFDPKLRTLFIRSLKGSSPRELPLRHGMARMLGKLILGYSGASQLALADRDRRIFPISYSRLQQIWQRYRPVPKKFHALRHSFAVNLYGRSRNIKAVQLALGHRSILNTMVYVDFHYNQTAMRKIMHGRPLAVPDDAESEFLLFG